ncbi:MAG: DUF2110 family protein [Candidatus Kariarchaeaceae archaeon]|jgi:hypothetical protein
MNPSHDNPTNSSKDLVEIELWFPSHNCNLGLLSKSLRESISSISQDLGYSIVSSNFKDDETFVLQGNLETRDNLDYLIQTLYRSFGRKQTKISIEKNDIVRGRLIDPGSVGFGIFIDVGIRPQNDVLMPLRNLRISLANKNKVATRLMVDAYGLVDHFPVELQIEQIDKESKKINVQFSDSQIQEFMSWKNDGLQRLLISKCPNYNLEIILQKLGIDKFIEDIDLLDPLSTIIVCKKRTRASGLLPLLGRKLGSVPIGIFRPDKIRSFSKE